MGAAPLPTSPGTSSSLQGLSRVSGRTGATALLWKTLSCFPKVLSFTPAPPLPGDAQKQLDSAPCSPSLFPGSFNSARWRKTQSTDTHTGPYFVFKHLEKFATSWVQLSHHSPSPSYQETGLFSCLWIKSTFWHLISPPQLLSQELYCRDGAGEGESRHGKGSVPPPLAVGWGVIKPQAEAGLLQLQPHRAVLL